MKTIKFLLLAALMLTYTISTYGQDKSHYMPKFAIKTNALYWATTTANLGFEVGLSKKLTLDVSGNYNPWKFSDHKQIKHWLVQRTSLLAVRALLRTFLRPARPLCRSECKQPEYIRFGTRTLSGQYLWSRHFLWISMDTEQALEHGSGNRCRLRPHRLR